MLEVVANHDYEKSRFLRGAVIDKDKIPDCDAAAAEKEAQSLRYLNPERTIVHLLDKPISIDDAQDVLFRAPSPLIIVGSAGSGKTALTLEKLKQAEGETLYVTHSAYLAQNARNLYYANGFERTGQEATFLSYREFVDFIHVLPGREADFKEVLHQCASHGIKHRLQMNQTSLNLPFIAEFTPFLLGWNGARVSLQSYLKEAGMPEAPLPIAEERMQGEKLTDGRSEA
jgi:hypothetical protein